MAVSELASPPTPAPRHVHVLDREQFIEAPETDVFDFFADAGNLERITPPWLHFRIQTPLPIEMETGARIEYTIRLAGVPMRWRTRITCWEPGVRFVDYQESGPYRLWEHLHTFRPMHGGVLMRDRVRYALPLGPLGQMAHALAVRSALAAIFDYRFSRIREVFATQRATPLHARRGVA